MRGDEGESESISLCKNNSLFLSITDIYCGLFSVKSVPLMSVDFVSSIIWTCFQGQCGCLKLVILIARKLLPLNCYCLVSHLNVAVLLKLSTGECWPSIQCTRISCTKLTKFVYAVLDLEMKRSSTDNSGIWSFSLTGVHGFVWTESELCCRHG